MPKFNPSELAKFVTRHPIALGASIVAPFFTQNDDRGYFRSAMITSPIVFAAGSALPKLFTNVAGQISELQNLMTKSQQWSRFENLNPNDLRKIFKDPGVTGNVIDRALSAYMVSEHSNRNFLREQKSLTRYFNRNFVITPELLAKSQNLLKPKMAAAATARIEELTNLQTSKGRLIWNAMEVSRRSSLTPAEWAQEAESAGVPAVAELNERMLTMFNQYQHRPEFFTTLSRRLQEVEKLQDTSLSIKAAKYGSTNVVRSPLGEFDPGFPDWAPDVIDKAFMEQRPEMYKNLQAARKAGRITDATIVAEQVTEGGVGKILNVSVTRREGKNIKTLRIPVVDMATGSVRLGKEGGVGVGVGTSVINPAGEAFYIDEWISKMLVEQPGIQWQSPLSDPGAASLEAEINAHAYYIAGDPSDAWRMGELESAGRATNEEMMSNLAIKLRSYSAGVTKLPLFNEGKTLSELDPEAKVAFLRDLLNSGKYTNIGSEQGTYEFRLQRREISGISPWGAMSAEKQDPFWRSLTKEFHLKANQGKIPAEGRPGWMSTGWQELMGTSELPVAKFTVAGIAPEERSFFGGLPNTIPELQASRQDILSKLSARMAPEQAETMFGEIEKVYQAGNQRVFRNLGAMGETTFLLNPEFSENFYVEGTTKYRVDELARKEGEYVYPTDVLGYNQSERVLPNFPGQIESIAAGEKNDILVNIRHRLGMQGAKLDVAGIKGMARVTETNEHFEQLRNIINSYYQKAGTGDVIPADVNTLAPLEYFTQKAEPAIAYMGTASDVLQRLQGAGQLGVAEEYLSKMKAEGITYNTETAQMIIDYTKNPAKNAEQAARYKRLTVINEEFFAKAGNAIRDAGGYQDPVLTAFVHSGKDLGNFYMKNSLPAMGFSWDHSLVNRPQSVKITHDIETWMMLGGNVEGLKALQARVVPTAGGDIEQMRQFGKYLAAGDFTKEMGTTVPLAEAFHTLNRSMTQAEVRKGTIFDPSIEAFKQNFRLELPGGKFLPVPGTGAYGAGVHQYAGGEYEVHNFQQAILKLAESENPESEIGSVLEAYKSELLSGKGGVINPSQFDPFAVAGVLGASAEPQNTFTARISPDLLEHIRSRRVRVALTESEPVYGTLLRQPTNQAINLRFVMDPMLAGTYDISVDESVSRMLMGDIDKDIANALMWEPGSAAAREAEEQVTNGAIAEKMAAWEKIKGREEVARYSEAQIASRQAGSLRDRAMKFADRVANRVEVAANRTAGAEIGAFSNVLTNFTESLVRNPAILTNPELATRLTAGLFDIRQAPISARKAKAVFDMETAQKMVGMMKTSVRIKDPEQAATTMRDILSNMAGTLSPKQELGPEYAYWNSDQGLEDLRVWSRGRTEEAQLMAEALTARGERAAEKIEPILRDLENIMGPTHGGRMADESASRLGTFGRGLIEAGKSSYKTATGEAGSILRKHGGKIALGLGAMALMGSILSNRKTPMATFSRRSSNKARPEEMMGVQDRIPGEPISGQMAPTNPPRRVIPGNAGVRTAVVAPLGQTSDITVKMKGADRSSAAETSRQIAAMTGSGNTNVTINYRDRTKLRSLRTRENVREILGK